MGIEMQSQPRRLLHTIVGALVGALVLPFGVAMIGEFVNWSSDLGDLDMYLLLIPIGFALGAAYGFSMGSLRIRGRERGYRVMLRCALAVVLVVVLGGVVVGL